MSQILYNYYTNNVFITEQWNNTTLHRKMNGGSASLELFVEILQLFSSF
jgi:hypothetical protein